MWPSHAWQGNVLKAAVNPVYLPVKTLGTHYQSRWAGIALLVQRLALQRIPAALQSKISQGNSRRRQSWSNLYGVLFLIDNIASKVQNFWAKQLFACIACLRCSIFFWPAKIFCDYNSKKLKIPDNGFLNFNWRLRPKCATQQSGRQSLMGNYNVSAQLHVCKLHDYMALSHKDWELPCSQIWLRSILRAVQIFPSRPVQFCGEKVAN